MKIKAFLLGEAIYVLRLFFAPILGIAMVEKHARQQRDRWNETVQNVDPKTSIRELLRWRRWHEGSLQLLVESHEKNIWADDMWRLRENKWPKSNAIAPSGRSKSVSN